MPSTSVMWRAPPLAADIVWRHAGHLRPSSTSDGPGAAYRPAELVSNRRQAAPGPVTASSRLRANPSPPPHGCVGLVSILRCGVLRWQAAIDRIRSGVSEPQRQVGAPSRIRSITPTRGARTRRYAHIVVLHGPTAAL